MARVAADEDDDEKTTDGEVKKLVAVVNENAYEDYVTEACVNAVAVVVKAPYDVKKPCYVAVVNLYVAVDDGDDDVLLVVAAGGQSAVLSVADSVRALNGDVEDEKTHEKNVLAAVGAGAGVDDVDAVDVLDDVELDEFAKVNEWMPKEQKQKAL